MQLISTPVSQITFQDVVAHCQEGHPEGIQLDYKRQMPRDLAKHFAAMSNSRGGLIIIGVAEDERNGLPSAWEGVAYDSKLLDQVHNFAANVDPIPRYEVQATQPSDSGKVFILIRVLEGDQTPYYVQNDANLWVRTGNISKRIDIAQPREVGRLLAKREEAAAARIANLLQMDILYERSVKLAKLQWHRSAPGEYNHRNQSYFKDIEAPDAISIAIQPFYPPPALVTPQIVWGLVNRVRAEVSGINEFPPNGSITTIPNGVMLGDFTAWMGTRNLAVLTANGLVYWRDRILLPNASQHLSQKHGELLLLTSYVEAKLACALKVARLYYCEIKYTGAVSLKVNIDGLGDYACKWLLDNPLVPLKDGLLPSFDWNFTFESELFFNPNQFEDFYISVVREIIWSLHFGSYAEQLPAYMNRYQRFSGPMAILSDR